MDALLDDWRLGHDWRHLLAADRLPALSPEARATDLIRANFDEPGIDLKQGEVVRLWPIEPEPWCRAVALAIDEGLAYGSCLIQCSQLGPPKLAGFSRRLAAACEPAEFFISGQFLSGSASGWASLTGHTFDFVAVVVGPERFAVLFVVDED